MLVEVLCYINLLELLIYKNTECIAGHVRCYFKTLFGVNALNTPLCFPEAVNRLFITPRKCIIHPDLFCYACAKTNRNITRDVKKNVYSLILAAHLVTMIRLGYPIKYAINATTASTTGLNKRSSAIPFTIQMI